MWRLRAMLCTTGLLDMVRMTRAHGGPHIVRKIDEGARQIFAPALVRTLLTGYIRRATLCIHNAATGARIGDAHDITRAQTPKEVVIVIAGPRRLEAAHCGGRTRDTAVTVLNRNAERVGEYGRALAPRRRE
jgi:hypothetical protein